MAIAGRSGNQGSIKLVGGQKYDIRLEYLEIGGNARISLFWSSPHTLKELIPARQLYPFEFIPPASLQGEVWLDINENNFYDINEPPLSNVTVLLYIKLTLV